MQKHDVSPHEAEEGYNSNPLYLDKRVEDGGGLKYQTYVKMLLHEALERESKAS